MDLTVSVKAETLFSLGPLNVTNSFLTMLIVMALLILVGALIARKATIVPAGRAQSGFEVIVEFLLNLVEGTAGRRVGRRIFPLISALFFFIIVSNYAGLLPGVGTIGKNVEEPLAEGGGAALIAATNAPAADGARIVPSDSPQTKTVIFPFLRSPNADLNMTLAMALITFTIVQVAGVTAHGFVGRIKHMADPPFLFPIEFVSELSRIVSLSFRLFGNIFAGEVLVTVMYSMSAALIEKTKYIAIFTAALPTVFLFLELLFGFVQALVFALLTLIYISLAAAGHGDHDEEHGHGPARAQAVPAAQAAGD